MLYESYQDNDFSFDQNIYNYLVEPKGIESRYVRIKGYNLDQCPDYHPGAGRPCWLFTDEIIINWLCALTIGFSGPSNFNLTLIQWMPNYQLQKMLL